MDNAVLLDVVFFSSERGNEPVRQWLQSLARGDCQIIGHDIHAVQFRWPVGMPLVRAMGNGLWEVRSHISNGRIARIFFIVDHGDEMVLLHGMVKKSQTTPTGDLKIANDRRKAWQKGT